LGGWLALLAASAFNRGSSPSNGAYCYTELAVYSLAMPVAITSNHFAYPWRDGQAELTWAAWSNLKRVYGYTHK